MMNANFALAENVVRIRYEDLPVEAREMAKRCILDTIGVMLAGSGAEPACNGIVDMVKEMGGREESTIIGYGGKVPALMAAFANGSMSHAVDYDDVHDSANCHPSGSTIPAALAMAERVGGVAGKDFIVAVALGIDVVCRLGAALPKSQGDYDFFLPPILGTFSSTAAAGKLLGLNKEQMVSAFGIAIHQAAGSKEMAADIDSVVRAIRDGFPGRNGVLSALMAARGITGVTNSLEGKMGLYALYFNNEYNPEALTSDLGIKFLGTTVSFKPWPSCRVTHAYIGATLDLVRENDLKPDEIEEITAVVDNNSINLCEPLEEKRNPKLSINAKLSIPYTVALAATRGKVLLGDFLTENLHDPAIHKMADKVNYQLNSSISAGDPMPYHAIVKIKTRDSGLYAKEVKFPHGNPKNPLSMEDLINKFRDCASYSVRPLSESGVDILIDLLKGLEEVEDISQVTRLLC
ncbi:MAG: MmgE/PrpD family protein [Deltaproteobacteria bacterium]|nr:MmgE/PrpD family protein [Deltaproteobacteria bacterium]